MPSRRSGRPDSAFNIYCAHALSAFGDRLWQFALPIVLVLMFPHSLLAPSLFLLVDNLLKIALVPGLGREIVRHDRLWVIFLATGFQCACCAGSMGLLLWWVLEGSGGLPVDKLAGTTTRDAEVQQEGGKSGSENLDALLCPAVLAAVVLGSLGDVASNVSTIATEKDWVVVVANHVASAPDGQDPADTRPLLEQEDEAPSGAERSSDNEGRMVLLSLNANLRQIDLLCKMLAPAALGSLLLAFPDSVRKQIVAACAAVMGWQLASVLPTYWMWRAVYYRYPGLAEPQISSESSGDGSSGAELSVKEVYLKSPLVLASLSYVMLHLTVLSESNVLTTAYLAGPGACSPILIVALRVGGAVSGLIGAAFCQSQGESLTSKGWWFLTAFWVCICAAGGSVILGHPPVSSYLLIAALVVSRFNLWSFDLTINTLIQTEVHPPAHRPPLTAVQTALEKTNETLMSLIAVGSASVLAGRETYLVLVAVSMSAISVSMLLFQVWYWCGAPRNPPLDGDAEALQAEDEESL